MTLNYYTKQNYGVEVMYLAKPAMAQAWYRMTGKKTINLSLIHISEPTRPY